MDQRTNRQQALAQKRKVFKLFALVCELPVEERPTFLDQSCGDDPALRQQLDSLLTSDRNFTAEPGLLGRPAFDVHAEDAMIGRTIGHYRLVRLLDRGGMGAVYLAERQDFEQQVALKLIRRGLNLDDVLVRRFHNERQILASLEHPHIARLLDGGTTSDRLPYFVMEYVEGQPIDSYSKDRGLSIKERLELFRKVCSAVQFAHQNLVIHRDLKPGNILINAAGEPKLLDFGIAKLLSEGSQQPGEITTSGQGPMTPRYASPEQIKDDLVTTASDVYSLGVLLYELLTGLDPYDVDTDRAYELARAICELPLTKPSAAVRRRGAQKFTADASFSKKRLGLRLTGDLDSITLKALHKEPQGRYGSAEQLSADILRYLTNLPVEARKGNFAYRARRFVVRNKLPLAVVLTFILLLTGSVISSTVLWRQAVTQREQAKLESKQKQDALEFLGELLATASPDQAEGATLTALEILERGKERLIEEDLAPELRIEIAGTLGKVYRELGFYERSREPMEMALAIAQEHFPGDHEEVAKHMGNLAALSFDFEDYEKTETLFRGALAMRHRLDQPPEKLFRTQGNFATFLMRQGKLEEAEKLHLSVLAARVELYGPTFGHDDKDIATSHRSLGAVYLAQGQLDKAELHSRTALDIRRRVLGSEHRAVSSVLDLLGSVLAAAGRPEEAEEMFHEALRIRQKRLGHSHPDTAQSKLHLADLLVETNPETTSILLTQALQVFYSDDPGGSDTADAEGLLGVLLAGRDRTAETKEEAEAETKAETEAEAETCLRTSYHRLQKLRGEDNIRTRRALARLQNFQSTHSLEASAVNIH